MIRLMPPTSASSPTPLAPGLQPEPSVAFGSLSVARGAPGTRVLQTARAASSGLGLQRRVGRGRKQALTPAQADPAAGCAPVRNFATRFSGCVLGRRRGRLLPERVAGEGRELVNVVAAS